MTDREQIIEDISVLYELALAAGNSLDLVTNCDIFLRTLMSRKHLSSAALWIFDRHLGDGGDGGATLVYANPGFRFRDPHLGPRHPVLTLLHGHVARAIGADDPAFAGLAAEEGTTPAWVALFSLGSIGVLKLASAAHTPLPDARRLNQLAQVLSKFTTSLEGCLAHERLVAEESARRRSAEEALVESEAMYQAIFEATGAAMAITGPDMRIRLVNRGMERLFGYPRHELIGTLWPAFITAHSMPETCTPAHLTGSGESELRVYDRSHTLREVLLTTNAVHGTGGSVISLLDISRRKRMEDDLRIKDYALASSINGIFITDLDGVITYANASMARMWGYRGPEQFVGRTPATLFQDGGLPGCVMNYIGAAVQDGGWSGELVARRADGTLFDVHFSATLVKGSDGRRLAHLCSCADITDQKKMEHALRVSEAKYRELADSLPQIVFELDDESRLLFLNRFGAAYLGVDREVTGRRIPPASYLDAAEVERACAFIAEVRELEQPQVAEFTLVTATGRRVPVLVHATPILHDGRAVGVRGTAADISKRKEIEDQVRRSLEEKEILLREVHHRVKNNLQVISALIALQTDHVTDPAGIEALRECEKRISSIALVHEKLYCSESIARIDFAEYLDHLLGHLADLYLDEPGRIGVAITVDTEDFPIDTAIPCGLIVAEAVSNAMKYAFPEGRRGRITVAISDDPGGTCTLVVSDDGCGFPPGFDPSATGTLGLHLIRMLSTRQLQGTLTIGQGEDGRGVTINIRFTRKDLPAQGAT